MTKDELNFAIRQALNNFDNWNDVTGCFNKSTSWYYEAQACIEDAVKIGSKIACEGIDADLSEIMGDEKMNKNKCIEGMHVHEGHVIAKGMKEFKCSQCGKIGYNYANGVEICKACRYELCICDICGKELSE